jgi:hypothetical protein
MTPSVRGGQKHPPSRSSATVVWLLANTLVAQNLPILNISSMNDRISASTSSEQLTSGLATFFGVVALLLASIGLYGLMAYAVAAYE